jgi:hypothetical protein
MTAWRNGLACIATGMVSACGGGGGGGDAPLDAAPVAAASAPAAASGDNSYRNFKSVGVTPRALPDFGDARAHLDVAGDGQLDLFVSRLTYLSVPNVTPATATPSRFSFWIRQANGSYVEDTTLLASRDGCIHSRKALVADFNRDGRPDVFVACHGFDFSPFPGERNKIVLSQPNGTYVVQDASPDVGFFHSASAADLNGDGFPDVVVVNPQDPARALVLLNKGDGTFQRETVRRLPSLPAGNYFSIELADVDGDGALDLLVGGHEFESAPTRVYINPGTNVFANVTPITISAVSGDGVVLDFVATGPVGNRVLWLLRTSGGDGTFYQSRVLQKVMLANLQSSVVVSQRPGQWIPWIIPATVSGAPVITSDNAADNISVPQ